MGGMPRATTLNDVYGMEPARHLSDATVAYPENRPTKMVGQRFPVT
jgi:hypothetical protein